MKTKLLKRMRFQAYNNLDYVGRWSGYWITKICGVKYSSSEISGYKYIIGDYEGFIRNAILDRVQLIRTGECKLNQELREERIMD